MPRLRRAAGWLAGAWRARVAEAFGWNVRLETSADLELARTETISSFTRDILYRRWATPHTDVCTHPIEARPAEKG